MLERFPTLPKIALLQVFNALVLIAGGVFFDREILDGVSGDFIGYAAALLLVLMPALGLVLALVGILWLVAVYLLERTSEREREIPIMIGYAALILASPVILATFFYLVFMQRALS